MTNKKPRYCKCGHLSHPTHDTPKSFLGFKYQARRGCNGIRKINETTSIPCECKRFLLESYPTKYDRISTYVLLGFGIFAIGIFLFTAYGTSTILECKDPTCIKILEEKTFTEGQALSFAFLAFLLISVWLFNLFSGVIFDHRYMCKREKRDHQE
uniref:ORF28 n=1 Tax=Nitrosopumilaceae spindle-shaped virus TaxID=3065433 RepID=A0AAT9J9X6_9VIRU